jgi:phosphopantothenoylcysteine decarboxylase/phosphopantothenate--cysteine ligase
VSKIMRDKQSLKGRRIVLGVTGGIAAYKSAELARELVKRGAELRVVMTRSATRFVQPLTFATLTQAPVCTSLWKTPDSWSIEHISNARWGDLLLVAPATANTVAKFAHGIADDALSTLYLAWREAVLLAPAMNTGMFEHPAYRANEEMLRGRDVEFIGPDTGDLACGEVGMGRLSTVERIVDAVESRLSAGRPLDGVQVLVTAGPTREFLDPIRFLSSPSSGKMGFAVAATAARMGAGTTLVAGPVALATPAGVERVDVVSAAQMHKAVQARSDKADILVFAAAVADFAPANAAKHKVKKSGNVEPLRLQRTTDVALEFGRRKRDGQVSVGFAADTEKAVESARQKLREKRFDLVVANPIDANDSVFGSDHNRGWLVRPRRRPQRLTRMTKDEMARKILQQAFEIFHQKRGA